MEQGHIWREGFASGTIKAALFRDVPDALVGWRSLGIKTYIYSSGSRGAQRDLFSHTTAGDLRPYLCGFFDTTVGPKVLSCTSSAVSQQTTNLLSSLAAKVTGCCAVRRVKRRATGTLLCRWVWMTRPRSCSRPT